MSPTELQRRLDEARRFLLGRDFSRALAAYEPLTRAAPQVAVVWFEYGNAASGARRFETAHRAWSKARSFGSHNAELLTLIGHQYQGLRHPDKAQACMRQAAAADPRAINPRISLAVLLEKSHRLEEARAIVNQCLALDRNDDQARYLAAVLDRRTGADEAAERQFRDLVAAEPRHPYVRYACRYELAQLLDRRGEFDEAMQWLAQAKAIVRALTDTDLLQQSYDRDAANWRRLIEALPKNVLSLWNDLFPTAQRSTLPPLAFLGGHPRSGTTLLEQVLDAHPGVAAFDESGAFAERVLPAFNPSGAMTPTRLNGLRAAYLENLLSEVGGAAPGMALVDKNPSPTLRLPVWLRVFPEIRIIIALRDPRDVVLSCYFQNLPLNGTNVNFLSLERLAVHYADMMDVWLRVREWENAPAIEIRYEDTVANLEGEGRRATEFLGLEWRPEQAKYHEKSRSKNLYSPTYHDVTQPVYTRALARWRPYEKHLAPILPRLEPYCRAFGYE